MKNIELTNKHKEMLLEMSKTLLPEIYSDDTNVFDIRGGDDDTWCIMHKNKQIWDVIIHWYEFVHTHLVEKILNPTPDKPCRNISGKFKNFFWESNCYWSEQNKETALDDDVATSYLHPVEYLYNIFKTK